MIEIVAAFVTVVTLAAVVVCAVVVLTKVRQTRRLWAEAARLREQNRRKGLALLDRMARMP